VRDQAERKALGKAGILCRLKREKPSLVIGIMGCMAQNHGDELLRQLPHLDFVAGTDCLPHIPDMVERVLETRCRMADIHREAGFPAGLDRHEEGRVCAMVSIMHGCDQFCTYCIVPHTRGREKSRPQGAIVEEVRRLADGGTREILLLGQNITAYQVSEARSRGDYDPRHSAFADLLCALQEVSGLERIRFTSPHVRYMNDHFVETVCALPKVCKCFHIPVQSGSDRILKLMHRGYTAAEYMDRIQAIRSRLPEVSFTTDVIVGFPTETEEDFLQTRRLFRDVGFDMGYIFRYSQREGTLASRTMPDDVPEDVKHERNQILLTDLEAHAALRNQTFKGRDLDVLVEGVRKRNPERWTGRTDLNRVCNFLPVDGIRPGTMARVHITRTTANSLFGEIRQD
jgi:tRNA-2-methylthio-N6-dimethylallyladenosine synthase